MHKVDLEFGCFWDLCSIKMLNKLASTLEKDKTKGTTTVTESIAVYIADWSERHQMTLMAYNSSVWKTMGKIQKDRNSKMNC